MSRKLSALLGAQSPSVHICDDSLQKFVLFFFFFLNKRSFHCPPTRGHGHLFLSSPKQNNSLWLCQYFCLAGLNLPCHLLLSEGLYAH